MTTMWVRRHDLHEKTDGCDKDCVEVEVPDPPPFAVGDEVVRKDGHAHYAEMYLGRGVWVHPQMFVDAAGEYVDMKEDDAKPVRPVAVLFSGEGGES